MSASEMRREAGVMAGEVDQAVEVVRPIEWVGGLDGSVRMIEQTRLPVELVRIECATGR